MGYAYSAVDNNGTQELISPGNVFSLELRDGYPHLAGFRTIDANNKVLEKEWTHLVATFPFVQFWVNGQEIPAQIITSGNAQFEEAPIPWIYPAIEPFSRLVIPMTEQTRSIAP